MPDDSTTQDKRSAYIISTIYVLLIVLLAVMLFYIWPPIPWPVPQARDNGLLAQLAKQTGCQPIVEPAAKTDDVTRAGEIIILPMKLPLGLTINNSQCVQTTFDERLLLLVIVAGMLGAFIHGATSLADYIGNNRFNRTWTWFYVLRPGIGMALALVFYFVIRGGFLTTSGGAGDINPYGIAALAGMVGMFSKQATDKLSEVFSTLFRSAGDAQRRDPLKPETGVPLVLEPSSVVAGRGDFKLLVSGTGFVNGAVVNVDTVAQTTTFESPTKLIAEIKKETVANPKTLKVTVLNKDKTTIGPVDLPVSAASATPPPAPDEKPLPPGSENGGGKAAATNEAAATDEKPVDGEGGDDDLVENPIRR
jgi:hypothetical protein